MELYFSKNSNQNQDINKFLNLGSELLRLGNYFEAEKYVRHVLSLDNKCALAWYQLAIIAENVGNIDKALEFVQFAVSLESENILLLTYQGKILLMMEKYDEAIDCFKKSIKLNLNQVDAYYYLAIAYQFLRRYEDAIVELRNVVDLKNNHISANQMLIGLLIKNGQWDQAVYYYKKSIDKNLQEFVFGSQIVDTKKWAEEKKFKIIKFDKKEKIEVLMPKYFGKSFAVDCGTVYGAELYAAELHQVTVIARGEILLTDDKLSLSEFVMDSEYGETVDLKYSEYIKYRDKNNILIDISKYEKAISAKGIYLGGRSSLAYGHWFAEHLPKLKIIQSLNEYKDWPIYVEADMPKSHYESLRLFLDDSRAIIGIPNNICVKFEKLLTVSAFTFFPYACFPGTLPTIHIAPTSINACRYIQEEVLKKVSVSDDVNRNSKIYLGRRGGARALKNSKEIEDYFLNIGFEILYCEDYSFVEQVKIFRNAEWVVGPNGSAFVNVIFCRPGTHVISFAQSYAANFPAWATAVEALGIKHIYVIGESLKGSNLHEHHEDYMIDLNDVRKAVQNS